MKKLVSIALGLLISVSIYSQGQLKVFQDWQSNAGSQNFLFKNRTKTDASNNIYVVGATMNGAGNYDILVAKYNPQGVQQWINQYNGTGSSNDLGTGVTIDASGNVYITGTTCTSALPTSADVIVIKYNSSGVQQWLQTYNGTGSNYDSGADIFQMTGTNVGIYVTGSSYNASGNTDYITIKYSTAGVQQWVSRYNHTSNLNDAAVRVGVNATGVTVIGAVETATTTYSCATVTYNALTGAQTGVTTTAGGTSTITEVNDMVVDASNNIYITGTGTVAGQGNNYFTIKLNGSLALQWQQTYNGASNLNDIAKGIQVDASGNVFVTGYSTVTGQGRNMVTIKYNSSGTQQWAQTYNNALNADDEAYGIALDNSGNAYVSGYNTSSMDQKDFYTIKYNTSGTSLWEIKTDGAKHLNDEATNIVVDNAGAIVVAGQSETAPGVFEYLTVKYVEKNIITPTDAAGESPINSFLFYENRGQILQTNSTSIASVKWYTNRGTPALYFKDNSYNMVFAHLDTDTTGGTANDSLHRIAVTFNNVGTSAKTYAMEKQSSYLNYFLARANPAITEVYGNQRLVTTDLYQNIDVVYCSNQNGFKYYFIIKPGGNPADIKMEYKGGGTYSLNGTTNALTISTNVGSITYDRPTVYQLTTANAVVPVTGWTPNWVQNGASNKYIFNIGTYDNTKALIIEVDQGNASVLSSIANINWSTYFGGTLYDMINKIKSDASNNLFAAGETWSALFPQDSGAVVLQPGLGGDADAFVAKFKPTGELEWTTYKGGLREDMIMSFDISSSGDIYAVGNTRSGDLGCVSKAGAYNNSTFVGPYETAHSYGWCTDGFIFQLNQAGNYSAWTTYLLTGNLFDWFNNCKFDASGRFFVVGTTSSSDAPVVASGTQYSHAFTNPSAPFNIYDGYIACFNPAGARTWATCLGSSTAGGIDPPDDGLYGLDFSQWGDLYVVGRSVGNNFPNVSTGSGATASTNYPQNGTRENGTITRFGYNNDLQYSSYMGGTFESALTSVWCNPTNDNALVTGYTYAGGYPSVNSTKYYYNSTYAGSGDAVFTVFNSSNQIAHSTYYGGNNNDEGWDIQMDSDEMIYIAGKSKSASLPLPAAGNPINTYTSGHVSLVDYFICTLRKFSTDIMWSTFLGGSGDESVGNGRRVSIAMDGNNYLHLAGQTNSTASFPTDNNGGSPTYFQPAISNLTDGTITRFDMGPVQLMSVDEVDAWENGIFVYPNPTTSLLSLQVDKLTKNLEYTVYNSLGQVMVTGKITELVTSLNMQNLNSGMYLIEIRDDEGQATTRFIKNN